MPHATPRDHSACSGCSLCLLVCPMWRKARDPHMTPEYLAKALQCGARPGDLTALLAECSLCGACRPVCPEQIDLPQLFIELRRQLPPSAAAAQLQARWQGTMAKAPAVTTKDALLLPGAALRADPAALARTQAALRIDSADDDGDDIAQALAAGIDIPPARQRDFLAALAGCRLVVADGLLLDWLQRVRPTARQGSLGAELSTHAAVRAQLCPGDLYVIEPCAYHAGYERLVRHYDALRTATGCMMNLDLQRIAIPVAGQAPWILQGRAPARIICESRADVDAFRAACSVPVLHISGVLPS